MYIKFKEVQIEGFQSIGSACTIPLENQGIILIKGINEYDGKASSNGSGKSSIVEAICWCLFGKTSSGIANVKNRYYKDGCSVTVIFSKNTDSYSITRSLDHKNNGTIVKVIRLDTNDDLSCRNKTDTDKLIKATILPFSQDVFLSTIFLSQGFSGRLSLLSPSARKERLEVLSNIDEAVSGFKTKLTDQKSAFAEQVVLQKQKISYLTGQLELYAREKATIDELQKQSSVKLPDLSIDTLKSKLEKIESTCKPLESKLTEYQVYLTKCTANINELQKQTTTSKAALSSICNKLNSIHVTSECPTCHQIMAESLSKEIEADLVKEASAYEEQVKAYKDHINTISAKADLVKQQKDTYTKQLNTLYQTKENIKNTIKNYEDLASKNSELLAKLSRLDECIANITELTETITITQKEHDEIEIQFNAADHMLKLVTKEFRAFLLVEVISEMNLKLKEYSKQLFENPNDLIQVSTDNAKLDILLGDSSYESLSGGERKKVDLALVLAQRDIALKLSGFQCNLLILDEILENCDETSAMASLTLLNTVAEEIESLYIISHNNYTIPVDRTLFITKTRNRTSSINFQ